MSIDAQIESACLYSNRAACHLSLFQYTEGIKDLSLALSILESIMEKETKSNIETPIGTGRQADRETEQERRWKKIRILKSKCLVRRGVAYSERQERENAKEDLKTARQMDREDGRELCGLAKDVLMKIDREEEEEIKGEGEIDKRMEERLENRECSSSPSSSSRIQTAREQKKSLSSCLSIPKTSYEFERQWRRLRGKDKEIEEFIKVSFFICVLI